MDRIITYSSKGGGRMSRAQINWLIGDSLPEHVALLEAVPGVGNVGKLVVDA